MLSLNNFSKSRGESTFQEPGGEILRVKFTRHTYESNNELFDLDILDHPIILDGKQVTEVFKFQNATFAIKAHYYAGPQRGVISETIVLNNKVQYYDGQWTPLWYIEQIRKHFNLTN